MRSTAGDPKEIDHSNHVHLTYFNDLQDDARICISHCLKKMCFTNGEENFLVEVEKSAHAKGKKTN